MISFAVLGSGSSGNSTVLLLHGERAEDKPAVMLIDAGLSPRATNRSLGEFGLCLADVKGIFITHFDADHFAPTWANVVEKFGVTVYVHHRHRRIAADMLGSIRRVQLVRDSFRADGVDGEMATALGPHDEHGTASYVFHHRGTRFGFATDIGRVTKDMLDVLVDLDGLAIESNYDPDMQQRSGRPAMLKRRIMGGLGHLSNAQSLDAVQQVSCRSILQHVVALHLSRECNEPSLVTGLYAREATPLVNKLTVTSQFRSTPMLRLTPRARCGVSTSEIGYRPGEQIGLF